MRETGIEINIIVTESVCMLEHAPEVWARRRNLLPSLSPCSCRNANLLNKQTNIQAGRQTDRQRADLGVAKVFAN